MFSQQDEALQERVAIMGLKDGWAGAKHFNDLLDCADRLLMGTYYRGDTVTIEVAHAAREVLQEMYDRARGGGKVEASPEDILALEVLVDVAQDYWSRQSGVWYEEVRNSLKAARRRQWAELNGATQ